MNIVPTYRYSSVSSSSPMPIDLNEDHNHHNLFNTNHEASASSSSYSILFNPGQNQGRSSSYYWEPKHIYEEAEKLNIPSRGSSWDYQEVERNENKSSSDHELKLKGCLKIKEDGNESLQGGDDEDSSVKWMPLKIRIIRRMMVDQTGTCEHKLESSQKLPLGTDNSSSNNNSSKYNSNNNITVRVCSDCHTTKTPLWRSGPRGPKSLCNACGIRQRKARRALAAAASANGTNSDLVAAEKKPHNKLQGKGKKKRFKTECEEASPQLKKKKKKKHKLGVGGKSTCRGRESKFSSFEDLTMRLSKNLSHLQQVFPQDEKEAAILLMALSYGLLHGFPSHRYLDS